MGTKDGMASDLHMGAGGILCDRPQAHEQIRACESEFLGSTKLFFLMEICGLVLLFILRQDV